MKTKLYSKFDENTPMLNRVLINRGVPINELRHYMNTTDRDINDFLSLGEDDLKQAAIHLCNTIQEDKSCLIIVDADCDGYTSSAILINYLYHWVPSWTERKLKWFLHSGKQHGLSDCIEEALCYDLIICPDSSSNDYDYHQRLSDAGIPVIVLDHHEAPEKSQYATIINNQLSDYPNKDLSGAGVTWQFCRYLDNMLEDNYANELLDLNALGNCGDMMSMLSIETKHLINKGFLRENIKNPFIYHMAQKNAFKLGNEITPMGAAFYIVPFVNAMVRSGTQEEKDILFRAMLNHKAFEKTAEIKYNKPTGKEITIAERAISVCEAVKRRQTKVETDTMEFIEKKIKENNMMDHKVLLFLLEPGQVDRNVAGLVANKIMAKYQRPCCILTKVTELKGGTASISDTGVINIKYEPAERIISFQGSARGCDKVGITKFKDICAATGYTMYEAGHQGAFGLGILEDNIENFINATDLSLADMSDEPVYYIDHIFHGNDVDCNQILEIANHPELWGSRMDEPYMMIEDLVVTNDMVNIYEKKTNTLKITLPNGLALIKFNITDDERDMFKGDGCIRLNIVGQCRKNEWMGNVSAQMEIKDYDIITQSKYYF